MLNQNQVNIPEILLVDFEKNVISLSTQSFWPFDDI